MKPATARQTLLLTGFDPFDGAKSNPSWDAASALDGRIIGGHRIVARQLPTEFDASLRALAAELGLKAGDFFSLVRVAVTGRRVTPPLFESMEILGRERSLERLRAAAATL